MRKDIVKEGVVALMKVEKGSPLDENQKNKNSLKFKSGLKGKE